MSKKKEYWIPPKDWSIYEKCWIKYILNEQHCYYAFMSHVMIDNNSKFGVIHIQNKGKGVSISHSHTVTNLDFAEVRFEDINFLLFDKSIIIEPFEFVTEEEALSGLSESAKAAIKFYLNCNETGTV